MVLLRVRPEAPRPAHRRVHVDPGGDRGEREEGAGATERQEGLAGEAEADGASGGSTTAPHPPSAAGAQADIHDNPAAATTAAADTAATAAAYGYEGDTRCAAARPREQSGPGGVRSDSTADHCPVGHQHQRVQLWDDPRPHAGVDPVDEPPSDVDEGRFALDREARRRQRKVCASRGREQAEAGDDGVQEVVRRHHAVRAHVTCHALAAAAGAHEPRRRAGAARHHGETRLPSQPEPAEGDPHEDGRREAGADADVGGEEQ